jgi:hypothetical protein
LIDWLVYGTSTQKSLAPIGNVTISCDYITEWCNNKLLADTFGKNDYSDDQEWNGCIYAIPTGADMRMVSSVGNKTVNSALTLNS